MESEAKFKKRGRPKKVDVSTVVRAEPLPVDKTVFRGPTSDGDEARRLFVLKCHGEFIDFAEISRRCLKKEYTISVWEVEKICTEPSNRYTIQQYRNQYLNKVKSVALANKRVRLDDLDYLRSRFLEILKANDCGSYDSRAEFRSMSRALLEILGAARDEMEGKGITLLGVGIGGGLGMGDFDGKSDTELVARREELIAQAGRALIGRASGANDHPEGVGSAQALESS